MNQIVTGNQEKRGLEEFVVYRKKTIFIFFALSSFVLSFLVWSLLTGRVESFSVRGRTCHEIYNSVTDTGEDWITTLLHYFFSLLIVTAGYMGVLLRRDREFLLGNSYSSKNKVSGSTVANL